VILKFILNYLIILKRDKELIKIRNKIVLKDVTESRCY